MAEPARIHNQGHGYDRERGMRSPVALRPVVSDVARDPLLGGAVAAPPAPFAVLGRADSGARGRAMLTLQRRHGNAGVGQMVEASRRPIAIQRCGHGPCDCPPERKAAHAAAEITAIGREAEAHADGALGAELQRRAGGGQPLDPGARAQLEPAMGLDLGAVSIHADAGADVLARAVSADAFTTGNDIYFRAGRYEPRSESGLRLLAHEITHTVQQGRGAVAGAQRFGTGGSIRVNDPDDAFERDAEQTASATMTRIGAGPDPIDRAALRPLARIPRGADTPIQRRATAISQPPFNVTFDPSVVVRADPAPPNVGRFDANPFRETLNVTPGSSGFIVFPVDMTWRRAVPGGGGGGGGGPPNGINCDLIPDETAKQACKAGQDPKAFLRSLSLPAICGLIAATGIGLVVFGPLCTVCLTIAAISALTGGRLPNFCQNALNTAIDFLAGLLGGGGGGGGTTPPTPASEDRGTGRATLETRFVVGADGKMQLFGPPPRSESNGVAAEVVSPVQFSQETIGSNGHLSIQPMIRSQITRTRPNGEVVPETHTFQRMFEVDLVLPPPPAPVGFCCGTQLFPFKVGKDTFVNEGAQQNKLLTWVRTQDQRVIDSVREGKLPVIIAGRASTTGSFEFNLKLSEDRARRAEQMVKDFFGSDAAVRTFAFGELTAPPPDAKERDEERRADIKITGEIAPPTPVCGTGSTEEACAGTSPVPATTAVAGGGPVGEATGGGGGGGGGGTGPAPDPGAGSGGGGEPLVLEDLSGGQATGVAPSVELPTGGIAGSVPQDDIGGQAAPPAEDKILDQGAGMAETTSEPEQTFDDGGTVDPGTDAGGPIEDLLAESDA